MVRRDWIDLVGRDHLSAFMWMRDNQFRRLSGKTSSFDGLGGISSLSNDDYLDVCKGLDARQIELLHDIWGREALYIGSYKHFRHDIRRAFETLGKLIDAMQ